MTEAAFREAFFAAQDYMDAESFVRDYGERARRIWDTVQMPFRDFMLALGLTRAELCERYYIPMSTVDQWRAGRRYPPPYVRLLLAIATGYIQAP